MTDEMADERTIAIGEIMEVQSVHSLGLQDEVAASGVDDWELASARQVGRDGYIDMSGEAVEIAFSPSLGRAGLAGGGEPTWTDADSVQNALERFWAIDGKILSN